jgi:anti-sigma B factor antagonist
MPGQYYPVLWIGQAAVLTLPAEIDITNADSVREDLLSVLNQGAVLLIADLSSTTFCDSAGVSALVRTYRRAAASESGMRLVVGTPAVQRVLAITGVDRLLDIYPSVAASLAGGPLGRGDTAQPENAIAKADADGGLNGEGGLNGLERGRRLRGLAAHSGNDRAGDITKLDIAVL